MPATPINATAGSPTANAYVTLAVANQYHLDRPAADTVWATATDDQKTAAILWATKLIESMFIWEGSVVDTTQRLLWPRSGLSRVNNWDVLPNDEIPERLQWATAEFARQLLAEDRTADNDIQNLGITMIKTSSVRLDFKPDGIWAKPIPDIVVTLIPRMWGYPVGQGMLELRRA